MGVNCFRCREGRRCFLRGSAERVCVRARQDPGAYVLSGWSETSPAHQLILPNSTRTRSAIFSEKETPAYYAGAHYFRKPSH